MGERRKRQRISENGDALFTASSTTNDVTLLARKETNASARRSLFVRSLPATATSESLTELFSENYPLKHATVVIDPVTKQSKGYGFVTFADADDARRARDEFHGYTFQGRKIKVEVAEPRHRETVVESGLNGKRKSSIVPEAIAAEKARQEARKPPKLIIRNLPWSIKEPDQLAALFLKFGKVKHATLPKVKKDTQAGFGFIVMRGRKNAEKAMEGINGQVVDGRTLAVDWAVEKEVWESQKQVDGEIDEDETVDGAQQDVDKAGIGEDPPFDGHDDVAEFMKNHFGDLEDDEEEEVDADPENDTVDNQWKDEDEVELSEAGDNSEVRDWEDNKNSKSPMIIDNSTTLFIRNLPFTALDADLKEHFMQFGSVRYARAVMDRATERPRGTGFVCFFNIEDADKCFRDAPRHQPTGAIAIKNGATTAPFFKRSVLQNEAADQTGRYTIDGRILHVSRAVEKTEAVKLTELGSNYRDDRDKDKCRLYLLSEGTVAVGTPLYGMLPPSEVKMRQDSANQRKKLIQNNATLHLSLTRLSIRNLPRSVDSKALKALARDAVVGFATDVKDGKRSQLTREEEARGGVEMREAEKQRKAKGKGIVRQSKIVFEGREGTKVSEDSGAGRSRGYGFIEYSSHRWALMGLRWLNGHAVTSSAGKKQRLIVEFAIENAQVVSRRKEREEKARLRSKEVLEARERGEAPDTERRKKVVGRDIRTPKTRKDARGIGKAKAAKAGARIWDGKVVGGGAKHGAERKRSTDAPMKANNGAHDKGDDAKKFKPGFPPGEDGRLLRRQQIIGKKRAMRKARGKAGRA